MHDDIADFELTNDNRRAAHIAVGGLSHLVELQQIEVVAQALHLLSRRPGEFVRAIEEWRPVLLDGYAESFNFLAGYLKPSAGTAEVAGFDVVDEPLALGGLRLCHHPQERADGYVLAGHLHPCVVLGGAAHQRLRLPCFHFGARVGVLPAFGAFTGMHAVRAQPGERLFVVAGDTVAPLPQPTLAA